MRLLWLADEFRKAGLKVVEVPGWQTRGYAFSYTPKVLVQHHTAGSANYAKYGVAPSLNIVVNGRPDLRGPLAQVLPGRDGTMFVVASGKANHAGSGDWGGVTSSSQTVGFENEHPGTTAYAWPSEQMAAIEVATAVVLNRLGQPSSMTCAHREWANPPGRKIDPVYGAPGYAWDMTHWRARVHLRQQALAGAGTGTTTPTEDNDMAVLIQPTSGPHTAAVFVNTGEMVTHLRSFEDADHLIYNGVLKDKTVVRVSEAAFNRLLWVQR